MSERDIAARVIAAMRDSGMSQSDLASATSISPDKLSKSLHGKRRFSSLDVALIAETTHTTVDALLGIRLDTVSIEAVRVLKTSIHEALDYASDTSQGDWLISYHEAAQRMCEILRDALKASWEEVSDEC